MLLGQPFPSTFSTVMSPGRVCVPAVRCRTACNRTRSRRDCGPPGLNARAAASDGDPAEAAEGAVRLAMLPDDGPTGEFFFWDGTPVPW